MTVMQRVASPTRAPGAARGDNASLPGLDLPAMSFLSRRDATSRGARVPIQTKTWVLVTGDDAGGGAEARTESHWIAWMVSPLAGIL